jgi:hypothetical protein
MNEPSVPLGKSISVVVFLEIDLVVVCEVPEQIDRDAPCLKKVRH